jgi:hypothetical protein
MANQPTNQKSLSLHPRRLKFELLSMCDRHNLSRKSLMQLKPKEIFTDILFYLPVDVMTQASPNIQPVTTCER